VRDYCSGFYNQVAGFEAQLAELKAAGCEKIFREQVSSVGKRSELEAAIDYCREGDVFLCTKLDRLARSISDLGEIIARLERKRVALRILNLNLDSSTPTGRLMLNLLGISGAIRAGNPAGKAAGGNCQSQAGREISRAEADLRA
jgi:DNA invertase Pin-like site-specific DNA recombinase